MTLQFNPGAYESAYEQAQNRNAQNEQQRNQLLASSVNAIPQAIQGYQQNQQALAEKAKQDQYNRLLLGLKFGEAGYDPQAGMSALDESPQPAQQPQQMSPRPGPWSNPEPQGMPAASTGGMYANPPSPAMSPVVAAHKQMLASRNPFERPRVDYAGVMSSAKSGDYAPMFALSKNDQANAMKAYEYDQNRADRNSRDNQITAYQQAMLDSKNNGDNENYTVAGTNKDGSIIQVGSKTGKVRVVPVPGGGSIFPTHTTDAQSTAAGYGDRAVSSHQIIENLFNGKVDPNSFGFAAQESRFTPNIAKSGNIQSFDQAKRNFLNAILRRESGAVISPSEFEEGTKQYFPVYGDTSETIKQKSLNRQQQIENLSRSAGPMASRNFPLQREQGTGKPQTVTQNGHTYTLNPSTGQYE